MCACMCMCDVGLCVLIKVGVPLFLNLQIFSN